MDGIIHVRHITDTMPFLDRLRRRAQSLKAETMALYFATRHPMTPWYAKLLVAGVVAYALSPIDLIPDFIPVLGYLDDLLLIPLGVALAIRMIPPSVLAECREKVRQSVSGGRPVSRTAAAVIIVIWIVSAVLLALWAYDAFRPEGTAPLKTVKTA